MIPRIRRPSPAMAMAVIALVVALAGGATAASKYVITSSAQVKDGAIAGVDLRNGSVSTAKLSAAVRAQLRSVGTAGAAGPQGPAGPAGPAGAVGPPGVLGFYQVGEQTEVAAGQAAALEPACQVGDAVTGGGFGVPEDGDYTVTNSHWSAFGTPAGERESWLVFVRNQGATSIHLFATAVCADRTP